MLLFCWDSHLCIGEKEWRCFKGRERVRRDVVLSEVHGPKCINRLDLSICSALTRFGLEPHTSVFLQPKCEDVTLLTDSDYRQLITYTNVLISSVRLYPLY